METPSHDPLMVTLDEDQPEWTLYSVEESTLGTCASGMVLVLQILNETQPTTHHSLYGRKVQWVDTYSESRKLIFHVRRQTVVLIPL